jgi:hypothetical protein
VTVAGDVVWDRPAFDTTLNSTINIVPIPRPGLRAQPARVELPGEFTLPMVPTLDYSLSIYLRSQTGLPVDMPASTYVKDITYGGSSVMYGSIRPGDATSRLRIIFGSDGGSMDITAARADGTPAVGAAVIILPAGTQSEAEFAATMKAGLTEDTGVYRITNVPPGRYYVLAAEDPPVSRVLPGMILDILKSPENLSLLQRVRGGGQLVEVGPRAAVQVRVTPRALN